MFKGIPPNHTIIRNGRGGCLHGDGRSLGRSSTVVLSTWCSTSLIPRLPSFVGGDAKECFLSRKKLSSHSRRKAGKPGDESVLRVVAKKAGSLGTRLYSAHLLFLCLVILAPSVERMVRWPREADRALPIWTVGRFSFHQPF